MCPLSWSVHCNFTGEGKCNERGWACTPHPHQPGLILPSSLNVRQKAAVATLWFEQLLFYLEYTAVISANRQQIWDFPLFDFELFYLDYTAVILATRQHCRQQIRDFPLFELLFCLGYTAVISATRQHCRQQIDFALFELLFYLDYTAVISATRQHCRQHPRLSVVWTSFLFRLYRRNFGYQATVQAAYLRLVVDPLPSLLTGDMPLPNSFRIVTSSSRHGSATYISIT